MMVRTLKRSQIPKMRGYLTVAFGISPPRQSISEVDSKNDMHFLSGFWNFAAKIMITGPIFQRTALSGL